MHACTHVCCLPCDTYGQKGQGEIDGDRDRGRGPIRVESVCRVGGSTTAGQAPVVTLPTAGEGFRG